MTSLTIKLPPALKAQVEAEATVSGKSVSAVVREALRNRPASPQASSLYERTQALCGAGDSGLPDLATHPRHRQDFGR